MTKAFLDRLEAGLSRLIEELEATRVRSRQLETEADGLRIHAADRDRLEERVVELEKKLTAASAIARELPGAMDELVEAKKEISLLHAEVAIARPRLIELEQELATIGADRDSVRSALYNTEKRATEIEQSVRDAGRDRDNIRQEFDAARTTIAMLENQSHSLRADRDKALAVIAEAAGLLEENEALKVQVYELQIKEMELEETRAAQSQCTSDLQSVLNREARTREQLTALIGQIEDAESLLETTEAVQHAQS